MKVILLKPKKRLGKIGDTVTVKNGYARNFLIPQKIAMRNTIANQQFIKTQQVELEEANAQALQKAQALATSIHNKEFVFIKQAASDGRLFGSVSNKEIAKSITKVIGEDLSYANIMLYNSIKSIGILEVTISLHPDVSTSVLLIIARSESEAKKLLNDYKNDLVSSNATNDLQDADQSDQNDEIRDTNQSNEF